MRFNLATSNYRWPGGPFKALRDVYKYIIKIKWSDWYSLAAETDRGWRELEFGQKIDNNWVRWGGGATKTCETCGGPIAPTNKPDLKHQRFCSTRCRFTSPEERAGVGKRILKNKEMD